MALNELQMTLSDIIQESSYRPDEQGTQSDNSSCLSHPISKQGKVINMLLVVIFLIDIFLNKNLYSYIYRFILHVNGYARNPLFLA